MAGLSLNFVEYELTKNTIRLKSVPYRDYPTKDDYKALRDGNQSFWFYRVNDKIYYWPIREGVEDQIDGIEEELLVANSPKILSKVIEVGLVQYLKGKFSKVKKVKHAHAWEVYGKDISFESDIPAISVKRRVTINPYFFKPQNTLRLGFTISTNTKLSFTWSKEDFEDNGFDTSSFKIFDDNTVAADKVAISYFLEASGLEEVYGQKIEEVEARKASFTVITDFVEWLKKKKEEIYLPDEIGIKDLCMKNLPIDNTVKEEKIYAAKKYYYNGATNTEKLYPNDQIKKLKPYSFDVFADKQLCIPVIYPSDYEGITEAFLSQLERTLKETLHIPSVEFPSIKINDALFESYKEGLYSDEELLRKANLFIVIINNTHKYLPIEANPYHYCKAKLIGSGIPTQDVRAETIKQYLHPLVLNNIALNIYAKIGGTAWTVEKEEKRKQELVIGVGSTSNSDGKAVLGIAQVFHSDGRYIVGDCAPVSTFDNYAENLEAYLFATLSKIINSHINTKERFRLIFHLYKNASQEYEINAIENLIKRLANFDFDFVLLHVGYGHNFRIYKNAGEETIDKGTFIKIDSNTALLHFVPDSIVPLKIELDKRSKGFNDLYSLSRQIFWFSSLSHRSYNLSKRTVTIMYPSLMAAMTEKMSKVPNWDYERLKRVSDKLWFI